MQEETHLVRGYNRTTVPSTACYCTEPAIQTPVTLLFQYCCGITFFDAAECQAASTAYDTLVDSISEHIL